MSRKITPKPHTLRASSVGPCRLGHGLTVTDVIDAQTFEASKHPAFVAAVNRAANVKVIQALKSGKLQLGPTAPRNPHASPTGLGGSSGRYAPRMDLVDDPSSHRLTAVFELPGIPNSEISLQIREGWLVVAGARKAPSTLLLSRTSAVKYPIQDVRYGEFSRSIGIPHGTQEADVEATLENGMLTVTWPRSPLGRAACTA